MRPESSPNRYEISLKLLSIAALVVGGIGALVTWATNGRFFGGNARLHMTVDPDEYARATALFGFFSQVVGFGIIVLVVYLAVRALRVGSPVSPGETTPPAAVIEPEPALPVAASVHERVQAREAHLRGKRVPEARWGDDKLLMALYAEEIREDRAREATSD